MATALELTNQMVAQLRVLDPSAAANPGSPERLLLETAAQSHADAQVDLTILTQSLDLDSKFGSNLDSFLGIFDFGRTAARHSEGFVTFGRNIAATSDIRIPEGTRTKSLPSASEDTPAGTVEIFFATTATVTLAAGETSVQAPVRSVTPGLSANVAATTITQFAGQPVPGITSVVNEAPTSKGRDAETDEEYKVRFQTTYLRNLAGTQDQYLALAVSSLFTTRANVIGPISRYREYVQVPEVDDATANPPYGAGNGNAGEYTTALSTIPYAEYIYSEVLPFVSNGGTGANAVFYRHETDFQLNLTDEDRDRGDTYRLAQADEDPSPEDAPNRPNVTFTNVYTGGNEEVEALRPGDVVLLEFSYVSQQSRNDYDRLVTNAVDVFIDSDNAVAASVVTARPQASTTMFVNDPTSKNHFENYRRSGEPEHRPMIGNLLMPLFFQPVTDVPEVIVVEGAVTTTYYRGVHYWAIEDVSELGGTARARAGIEWSMVARGQAPGDDEEGPYTGAFISEHALGVAVPIENYLYDQNVYDLQAACEASKQITTDVLAHKGRVRFFKFDFTVMYSAGYTPALVNLEIQQAVQDWLRSLYFGSPIQLSDLLQVVHNVAGVDNVRWSSDVPNQADLERAFEVDQDGVPLRSLVIDQATIGSASTTEVLRAYVTGDPEDGSVTFTYGGVAGTALTYPFDAAALQANLTAITGVPGTLTVSGSGTPAMPFVIDYGANGIRSTLEHADALGGGPTVFDSDFVLADDELASLPSGQITGDAAPGLVIRVRAQSTWTKR